STVRWSSIRRPVTSGATFFPASSAAPSEIGSPVPRSATSIRMAASLRGMRCQARVVGLAAIALGAVAQAGDRMRPFGLQAVFPPVLLDVHADDVLGRRPVVVHALLILEVAIVRRQGRD